MVETVEQEELRRINEVLVERGSTALSLTYTTRANNPFTEASCRLIEERRTMEADHQAFREKVSEVAEMALDVNGSHNVEVRASLREFILPPPVDPLVEALKGIVPHITCEGDELPAEAVAKQLRSELAKHGLKIERTEA